MANRAAHANHLATADDGVGQPAARGPRGRDGQFGEETDQFRAAAPWKTR